MMRNTALNKIRGEANYQQIIDKASAARLTRKPDGRVRQERN
jgi:hypothetical protein